MKKLTAILKKPAVIKSLVGLAAALVGAVGYSVSPELQSAVETIILTVAM